MAFSSERSNEVLSQINVTPLVDVMLVLLVIFMVTAPILQQGVSVNLPHVQAGALAGEEVQLVVTVNPQGKVYLNDTAMTRPNCSPSCRRSCASSPTAASICAPTPPCHTAR